MIHFMTKEQHFFRKLKHSKNRIFYQKHSRNQLWAKGGPPEIFENLSVGLKGK
jgi:hypothetical protein